MEDFYKRFCIIANCRTLSEAAEKLYVSKSSISKTISNFEKRLDTRLFYRSNKGISLTKAGEKLYEDVHVHVGIISNKEEELKKPTIKIGSYSHIISSYLSEPITKAEEDNLNLRIETKSVMRRKELEKTLIGNEVNFIIDNNENAITYKGIEKQKLKEVENIFIYSKPIKINDIKELQNFRYIIDTESSTDKKMIELLEHYGVSIQVKTDTNSTETKIANTKNGGGISYVIKDTAKTYLENKEIYEVKVPIELPKTAIVLMYLEGNLREIDKHFIKNYL